MKRLRLVIFGLLTAMLTQNTAALAASMPKGFVSTGKSKATGTMLLSSTPTEEADFTEYAKSGEELVKIRKEYDENFTKKQIGAVALYATVHLLNSATLEAADAFDVLNPGDEKNDFDKVMNEMYGSDYLQDGTVYALSPVFAKTDKEKSLLKLGEQTLSKIAGGKENEAKGAELIIAGMAQSIAQNKTAEIKNKKGEVIFSVEPSELSPGVKRIFAEYVGAGTAKLAQLGYFDDKESQYFDSIALALIDVANTEVYMIIKPYDKNSAKQARQ